MTCFAREGLGVVQLHKTDLVIRPDGRFIVGDDVVGKTHIIEAEHCAATPRDAFLLGAST